MEFPEYAKKNVFEIKEVHGLVMNDHDAYIVDDGTQGPRRFDLKEQTQGYTVFKVGDPPSFATHFLKRDYTRETICYDVYQCGGSFAGVTLEQQPCSDGRMRFLGVDGDEKKKDSVCFGAILYRM